MRQYKKWLHETLFEHHLLTRKLNGNCGEYQWCICPIIDGEIGDPLVFGETIQEVVDSFKNFLEIKEREDL